MFTTLKTSDALNSICIWEHLNQVYFTLYLKYLVCISLWHNCSLEINFTPDRLSLLPSLLQPQGTNLHHSHAVNFDRPFYFWCGTSSENVSGINVWTFTSWKCRKELSAICSLVIEIRKFYIGCLCLMGWE